MDVLDDQQEMLFANIMMFKSVNEDEVRSIEIEVVYFKY